MKGLSDNITMISPRTTHGQRDLEKHLADWESRKWEEAVYFPPVLFPREAVVTSRDRETADSSDTSACR